MHTSEQIQDLAAALSKAQGKYKSVEKKKTAKVKGQTKDGRTFEYGYKYADIADVLSTLLPVLSECELSVIQPTVLAEGYIFIRTRIMHSSGQWIESDYPVCQAQGDHQKMGGALTYARRYSLTTLVGVAAEEDVDGEGAEVGQPPTAPKRREAPREVVTSEPPLSQPESKSVCESMLLALDMCETREHLHAWATSNSAAKQRLTSADQAILKGRFELKQKDIKNARAPMSEAAE